LQFASETKYTNAGRNSQEIWRKLVIYLTKLLDIERLCVLNVDGISVCEVYKQGTVLLH